MPPAALLDAPRTDTLPVPKPAPVVKAPPNAKRIPEQFRTCRRQGHAWDDYEEDDWIPLFGEGISLRCLRCGTLRRDTINSIRNGEVGARNYLYPEGYSVESENSPSRSEMRMLYLNERRARLRERAIDTTASA